MKIQKKKLEGGWVGSGEMGGRVGGQGGCERRIAVFVKIQTKHYFLGVGGRVGGGGSGGG